MDRIYDFFSQGLYDYFNYEDPGLGTHYTWIKIFVAMLVIPVLVAVIFYKVIDSPVFNKKRHWLLCLLCVMALNWLLGYLFGANGFESFKAMTTDNDITIASGDFYVLGFVNALYAGIWFFVFSCWFKRFSINASNTPF